MQVALKGAFSSSLSASSLSCYRCGDLSESARDVADCLSSNETEVEQCGPGEGCVVFKRLYKKASGE